MSRDPILAAASELDAARRPYVLATVVWRRRPTSGKPGAKALVLPDGTMRGWLGGACAGPAVIREALRALAKGRPRLLCLGPPEEFPPAGDARIVEATHCASEGAMEIFLEPRIPVPQLVTIGEAPAGVTFGRLAEVLGYDVKRLLLSDDGLVDAAGGSPEIGDASWVLVATMGEYDEAALAAALASSATYVALVASQKRAKAVLGELRGRGVAEEQIARVRSPAGLDLGPISHEEIAVAVLAEIVKLKAEGLFEPAEPAADIVTEDVVTEARDPVCGMTVRTDSRHRAEHEGQAYYFCCGGCRERFVADPASFL